MLVCAPPYYKKHNIQCSARLNKVAPRRAKQEVPCTGTGVVRYGPLRGQFHGRHPDLFRYDRPARMALAPLRQPGANLMHFFGDRGLAVSGIPNYAASGPGTHARWQLIVTLASNDSTIRESARQRT